MIFVIKIENYEVVGWEHAIRGMRNPMNSWGKSDSKFDRDPDYGCSGSCPCESIGTDLCGCCYIGPNDHELMMKLAQSGPVHAKYRRMIVVHMDITAPLYWWKEFETYRVGVCPNPTDIEINSCSTMHKIHEKEFTLDDFSHEYLNTSSGSIYVLKDTIDCLNEDRNWYLKWDHMNEKDREIFGPHIKNKKDLWYQMIQLLPSSYNQKRTVMLNYEVLANIYEYRKDHKLDEWRDMCEWIETLPYSELITGNDEKGDNNEK